MNWEMFATALGAQTRSVLAKSGDESGPMNLAQHMADSGAVAEYVWDNYLSHQTKEFLIKATSLSREEVRVLAIWCAAAHDIGKASICFQEKLVDPTSKRSLIDSVMDAGLPVNMDLLEKQNKPYHAAFSGAIQLEWLCNNGARRRKVLPLVSVAEAHHGLPADASTRGLVRDIVDDYPAGWKAVHRELLDSLAQVTGISDLLSRLDYLPAGAIEVLTGFVVMCDWIASNTEAFPTQRRGDQASRVIQGMAQVELTHPWIGEVCELVIRDPKSEYLSSFGWPEDASPREVQVQALRAAVEAAVPALVIIEAPTGEGKTEAAFKVAEILGKKSGAQGVVLAAPTMATANGLFDRFKDWAKTITPPDTISSLYLAHSKNRLLSSYNNLRLRNIGDDDKAGGDVVAGSWLSGRKKGMLSNFVIGTVDQVLMMALQMRHSMLRHVALSGKVVIIDECHAYDAYTSSYLQTTLKWLAEYGASVIMLSATLPLESKRSFVEAYSSAWKSKLPMPQSTAYPLITIASEKGLSEIEVAPRGNDAEAEIRFIEDDLTTLVAEVRSATEDGGCILVISNTIRRAQESFEALAAEFPGEVELHHSAFAANDRSAKEERLLQALGKKSHRGSGRPHRLIVCGTQVLEQSLDIDADLLITDIAPIDLIIQRLGRVHRHSGHSGDRPERMKSPMVLIRGIRGTTPTPEFDPGTEAIYDNSILLGTYYLLTSRFGAKPFKRPEDVPDSVQFVYDTSRVRSEIPEEWRKAWEEAVDTSVSDRAQLLQRAGVFQLPAPKDAKNLGALFERIGPRQRADQEDIRARAQVRDTDPSIEVIPIIGNDYGYRALSSSDETMHIDGEILDFPQALELASSSLRLPSRFARYESVFEATITQLELDTPEGWAKSPLLKGEVALRLDENNRITLGKVVLEYSHEIGLHEVERK
ncbi:hypothetical protein B843_10190 [Corynebacterium vitaeruminis DSM 20294]|uniref:CRISPR-associated helicase Cas3 n=3 Tax=Corynebacterium vitaeruminis TaxID=38305 RepID=W5YA77_9CORY|nr:hypothetical protein B843_10190 [Corynebacterium vitaeruminis DSM 20294]